MVSVSFICLRKCIYKIYRSHSEVNDKICWLCISNSSSSRCASQLCFSCKFYGMSYFLRKTSMSHTHTPQCSHWSLVKSIQIFGFQGSVFSFHKDCFFVQTHTDRWEVKKVKGNAAVPLNEGQRLMGVPELLYLGGVCLHQ